jgi:hypothetical protein
MDRDYPIRRAQRPSPISEFTPPVTEAEARARLAMARGDLVSILLFTRMLFSMSRDHALHPALWATASGLSQPMSRHVVDHRTRPRPALRVLLPARHQDGHLRFDHRRGLSGRLLLRADRAGLRLAFPDGGANGHRQICFSVCLALARRRFCFATVIYNVPTFDLTTNILGAGSIAIGIAPYLWSRRTASGRVPSIG